MEIERCCKCDKPTGRAGKEEDSLYAKEGWGPFCEDCYDAYMEMEGRVSLAEAQVKLGYYG